MTAVGGTSLGVGAGQHARARDRLGHVATTRATRTTLAVHPHRLAVRRRRRREPDVRRARRIRRRPAPRPAAAVPDVAAVGDPQTGLLDRPDADVPGRNSLRRVPHRRHQPVEPDLRRPDGARRPGGRARRTASPTRCSTPTPARSTTSCRSRRPSPGGTSTTASTRAPGRRTSSGRSTTTRARPTQSTHAGWDNVTGLGTPTANFLATFGQ